MRSARTAAVVGLLTVATALSACSSGSKSTGNGSTAQGQPSGTQYASGKTFTLVLNTDPGNLDPHFTSLSTTLQADQFLYDSLVDEDSNGKLIPGLAQQWDGSTTKVTYTLRKGITCSDGTPLTASDVADNINFVGNPANKSSRIGVFVPPGAKATADDTTGTVTVTSPTPDAFLAQNVGGLQIVCKKGMANRALLKEGADGTGMFTLTDAVPGDHYTLTRRKDYAWGPGNAQRNQPGLPDTVVLKVVTNETTSANLLLSHQVNAALFAGPDAKRLAASKLYERDVLGVLGELWLNEKPGMPTADEAVRRGLVQALDLSQIGKVLTGGTGKAPTGLVAPGMGPCNADTVSGNLPASDATAAKATLDAAGWTAGADGKRQKNGKKLAVTLYYATSLGPTVQSTAELFQNAWSGVGVDVTLKGMSDVEAGSDIVGGQAAWTAALVPLNVTLPSEIVPFLSGPTPPNGTNFSYIDNAQYAASVQKASSEPGAQGCPDWNAAEKSLFQHVNVVPFVDSSVPIFAQGATFELSEGSLVPSSIRMLR